MNFLNYDILDNIFIEIKTLIDIHNQDDDINNFLPKIGIYSREIAKNKSMHQGKDVEESLGDIINATILDEDCKNVEGRFGNCDFIFNDLKFSVKSSIRKDSLFSTTKENTINGRSKIFDFSRKSDKPKKSEKKITQEEKAKNKLKAIHWEIPFLFYVYDAKEKRGKLFITALSEIALFKNEVKDYTDKEMEKLIFKLFKSNGSSQYMIEIDDVYKTAYSKNRVIDFSITDTEIEDYIKRKRAEQKKSKAEQMA